MPTPLHKEMCLKEAQYYKRKVFPNEVDRAIQGRPNVNLCAFSIVRREPPRTPSTASWGALRNSISLAPLHHEEAKGAAAILLRNEERPGTSSSLAPLRHEGMQAGTRRGHEPLRSSQSLTTLHTFGRLPSRVPPTHARRLFAGELITQPGFGYQLRAPRPAWGGVSASFLHTSLDGPHPLHWAPWHSAANRSRSASLV